MSTPAASPEDAPPPPPAPVRVSSSHMESSVTRLLVATKMLLESLTKWAAGLCSEEHVSDIYVRLGNDFNAARMAFGSYGISMAELESVPDDLRACLEACLSEDASQAALDRHLPQVRQIVVGLLQGLKAKQALYKDYLLASRQSRQSSTHAAPLASLAFPAASPAEGQGSHSAQAPSIHAQTQAQAQAPAGSYRSSSSVSSRSNRPARAAVHAPAPPFADPAALSSPPSAVAAHVSADIQAARRESFQSLEKPSSRRISTEASLRRGVMGPRSPPPSSGVHGTAPRPSPAGAPPSSDAHVQASGTPPRGPPNVFNNNEMDRNPADPTPEPPYPTPLNTSPPGRDKSLPPAPMDISAHNIPVSRHAPSASMPSNITSRSKKVQQHSASSSLSASHSISSKRSPLPTIEADTPLSFPRASPEGGLNHNGEDEGSDPSLRALKSRDALERRASKRFSAYTLNKMGISPAGFNAALANMSNISPTPKRGVSRSQPTAAGIPANLSPNKHASPLPDAPLGPGTEEATHLPVLPGPIPGPSGQGNPPATAAFARGPKSAKRQSSLTSKTTSPGMSSPGLETMPEPARTPVASAPAPIPVPASASASAQSLAASEQAEPIKPSPRDDLLETRPGEPLLSGPYTGAAGPGLASPLVPFPAAATTPITTNNTTTTTPHAVAGGGGDLVEGMPARAAGRPAVLPSQAVASSLAEHSDTSSSPFHSGGQTIHVFVQLGPLTKKASLNLDEDTPLTVARLRLLFVDRFGYSPGQDDFPPIYVKDPFTGVMYELEDLTDVRQGTLLTLNIDGEFYSVSFGPWGVSCRPRAWLPLSGVFTPFRLLASAYSIFY